MSAWIVTKNHIDTLVYWGLRTGLIEAPQQDRAGRDLWRENVTSVTTRYPNEPVEDLPGPIDFTEAQVDAYTFELPAPVPSTGYYLEFEPGNPRHAWKQVECYEYQSCEHSGYGRSWAKSFCDGLAAELRKLGGRPRATECERIPWGV
jgi:hypothetical protein